VWFYYEVQSSDQKIEALLDKNDYEETDLITIRIPLSLPYQNDSKDFERISGEVNFNGKVYKYVKRKIENGEFVLMCLPDQHKTKLEKQKNDYFENSNDLVQNNSKKSGNSKLVFFKRVFSEYDQYSFGFKISSIQINPCVFSIYSAENLPSLKRTPPGQPPDISIA